MQGGECFPQEYYFLFITYFGYFNFFLLVLWGLSCNPQRILSLKGFKLLSGSSVLAAFGAGVVDPQQILQDSWQENRAHWCIWICYNFFFPLLPIHPFSASSIFSGEKSISVVNCWSCSKHHGQERSLCRFGSPITQPLLWPSESPVFIYGNFINEETRAS